MTRRVPWLTIAVFVVTAVCTTLQFVIPGVLPALRRQPSMLEGEVWRFATAWLVHDDGFGQIAANFTALAITGTIAEWIVPRRLWLAAYVLGGLAGEVAGLSWQPIGAGNSVAILGLVGMLLVWLATRQDRSPPQRFAWPALGLAAALVLCSVQDIHGPALLMGYLVGIVAFRPLLAPGVKAK